jgi:hypothetical protein
VKDRSDEVVLTHIYHAYLEDTIADAHEHPPGMPNGRKPAPEKLVSDLQTTEFQVGKVLFDRFMEDHNVNLVFAEVIF